eukprot:238498-Rhodomonas_salina.3
MSGGEGRFAKVGRRRIPRIQKNPGPTGFKRSRIPLIAHGFQQSTDFQRFPTVQRFSTVQRFPTVQRFSTAPRVRNAGAQTVRNHIEALAHQPECPLAHTHPRVPAARRSLAPAPVEHPPKAARPARA